MKKFLVGFYLLVFVNQISVGQSFLNGSFEINNTICQVNISNATFDSAMTDVKAIGDLEMISIYDTSGCGYVEDGKYAINLMSFPNATDAVSLRLSDSLQTGNFYSISFYQHYFALVTTDSIEIGVSDNDSTFGTLVALSPAITIADTWIQRTVNFIAPISGSFITVRAKLNMSVTFSALDNFTITATTALNNLQIPNTNFQIYPNPAKDFINISFTLKEEKNVSVEVYDLYGRKVFEKELQTSNTKLQTQIDMRGLSDGIYIVEINTGEGIYRKKVVKE